MNFTTINTSITSLEVRKYICEPCGKYYERFIVRNRLGLIKHDTIYETNKEGIYLNKWD